MAAWDLRLMGNAEVAVFLGVSHQRVGQLKDGHPDFPQPVAMLRATPVWLAHEIEAFEKAWDRRPGKRKKR